MESTRTKRENGYCRVAVSSSAPSMTEQRHKKACNINTIMAKIRKGHAIPLNKREPIFGDFSQCTDFHTAQNMVLDAHDRFMDLPADLRRRFKNSPQALLAFMENPDNLEEGRKLGLLKPEEKGALPDIPPIKSPEKEEEGPQTGD